MQALSSLERINSTAAFDILDDDLSPRLALIGDGRSEEAYFLADVEAMKDRNKALSRRVSELESNISHTMRTLAKKYRSFQQEFTDEVENSKMNLRNRLISAFMNLSKEKLPDIYLRCIPKFGGTPLSNALHTTLVKMKRLAERNEGIVTVHIPKDVRLRIDELVTDRVQTGFLKPEVVNREVASIQTAIEVISSKASELQHQLRQCVSKNRDLIEHWHSMKTLLRDTLMEERGLREDFRQKEDDMDHKRAEILKYDKKLQEQRKAFHKENITLSIHLQELTRHDDDMELPLGEFSMSLNERMKKQEMHMATREKSKFEQDIRRRAVELEEDFQRQKRDIDARSSKVLAQKRRQISDLESGIASLRGKIASVARKKALGLPITGKASEERAKSGKN